MKEIRANLLHLGFAMWAKPAGTLECEDAEWRILTDRMAASGFNMALIDVGEGLLYESHPEISAKGAWPKAKLSAELSRLRGMGIEPVPKLNFSAAHDIWLGEYHRMLSTPEYYRVCEDLIAETAELFGGPRLFHFGYDEEDVWDQVGHQHLSLRQGELWWHDLLWFVRTVEKHGMRPWMWSDRIWEHRDEFLSRMPRSVVQSNWYDAGLFDARAFRWPRVANYVDLDRHGFDQMPTSSNFVTDVNTRRTVEFCQANISRERLMGFLQTSWLATTAANRAKNVAAIDQMAAAMATASGAR